MLGESLHSVLTEVMNQLPSPFSHTAKVQAVTIFAKQRTQLEVLGKLTNLMSNSCSAYVVPKTIRIL